MKCPLLLVGGWLLFNLVSLPSLLLAGDLEERVAEGEKIFLRDWSQHDPQALQDPDSQVADSFSDGLGPLFNAVSCVACHSQGGTGGGGPNDQNVRLLSLVQLDAKPDPTLPSIELHNRAEFVRHPNLIENQTTVLHRFGRNKGYADLVKPLWEQDHLTLLGWEQTLHALSSLQRELGGKTAAKQRAFALLRTERNTPALFGAGLIDSIDREELERIAEWQAEHYPEITGEVAPRGGKFGWRGQVDTLRKFVLGACANELGLQVKGFPQANDVLTYPGLAKVEPDPTSKDTLTPDVTEDEITALVSYVEQLPPPSMITPKTVAERFVWERGQRHFAQVQCNACHVARIGMVKGIYSDLLLHDMGPELFDSASLGSQAGSYFGVLVRNSSGQLEASVPEQKWRTPPLWGVGNSAPYMHDGRAATIDEAIRHHGGEAARSVNLYLRLKEPAQRELVAYVKSLGAPAGENILARMARRRGEKIELPPQQEDQDLAFANAGENSRRPGGICSVGCSMFTELVPPVLPEQLVDALTD